MRTKTIQDLVHLDGRRVLVRVDFNVPLRDGQVADDHRVRAAVPTLISLLSRGARVLCASHLGRPGGTEVPALSLSPVADVLSSHLKRRVTFISPCVGPRAESRAAALPAGEVALLENVRFEPGETENDGVLAARLAALADAYVNDAFGTAHRAHASTEGVARLVRPAVAGALMEREVRCLTRVLEPDHRPYVAVLGGAKIAGKIDLIEHLIPRVDHLLIGGAMAYTFLVARGVPVGRSLVDRARVRLAGQLLTRAEEEGVRIDLPVDHVTRSSLTAGSCGITSGAEIAPDELGGDIGPRTVERFAGILSGAGTILWNGPLGAFEHEGFESGTRAVAEAIRSGPGYSVVGGGDSAAALRHLGVEEGFDHISTGGGASLAFLSGQTLPGLAALEQV
ncbi:MAG: phosphoglycerate kinase [Acidobacteriota bacterium]